ncbi:MAG: glycosyltransferase [Brevinematales bacterium]|nr:glycosyltransferase [Brevinematales bacterium]
MKRRFFLISLSYIGEGALSGGDRISTEILRYWQEAFDVFVVSADDYLHVLHKTQVTVPHTFLLQSTVKRHDSLFHHASYILERTWKGIQWVLRQYRYQEGDIVYSSSDFWPDSIPAFLMKLRYPRLLWVAGFYLFAPPPWAKNSPYKGKNFLRGLFYYLTQLPMYWLIKLFADRVFVTSEPDKVRFVTKQRASEKVMVIQGFVCMHEVEPLKPLFRQLRKSYDGCFMARLHYQKGCLELIEIWKRVVEKRPMAQLAIIGDGPLRTEMEQKVHLYGLEKNVDFLGTLLGEEKYRIFAQSRVMLHPATYDSGGMAMAEGMAFGLPGVSFDLEALKTYYPMGVIKTPCFDIEKFAENVLLLLQDETLYRQLSEEATTLIQTVWDSRIRNQKLLQEFLQTIA